MIPTRQVTFLFTDVEGSTRLAQEFPQALSDSLRKHHEIVESIFRKYSGFIFKVVGDAICCAFENAGSAVKAAVEVQSKLALETWNDAVIRIRIGIHSGKARWDGQNYIGHLTLAQTSRIMSAAHGGQILISKDALKIEGDIPDGKISFIDLGEMRLKDLLFPVHIYQVESDRLRKDFPALRSTESRLNNIPALLTSFIGREKEIDDIAGILSESRLLTLAGVGGTGKTRLALESASVCCDNFANGVWLVEFAGLSDHSFVSQHTASSLKLNIDSSKNTIDTITDYLHEKEFLLILDNCEHLLSECSKLCDHLLRNCPKLKIICTSREALKIDGENIYAVPSLSLPGSNDRIDREAIQQYEASRLFIDRAMSLRQDFMVTNENAHCLVELCRKLDGIPLAIELAAARTKVLSVEKILEKINDRFSLLSSKSRDSLPRQQTLRAMIDWSYDLLSQNEKTLFQRLSIFSGGWTLEAAEQICSDMEIDEYEILDLLSNLIDKSLVTVNEDFGKVRYNMLETIRQYSIEKLDNIPVLRRKHSDFFLNLAKQWEKMQTELGQIEALEILGKEHDNFRDALSWSLEYDPLRALEICAEYNKLWELHGFFLEGYLTSRKALEKNPEADNKLTAEVILIAGYCAIMIGEYDYAEKILERGLHLFRLIGDKSGEANVMNVLGLHRYHNGRIDEAKSFYEQSLTLNREANYTFGIPTVLVNLGSISQAKGDYDEAYEYYEEGLRYYKADNNIHGIARTCANMGSVDYYRSDFHKAISLYEEGLSMLKEIGDSDGVVVTLLNLGNAHFNLKEFDVAEQYYRNCLSAAKDFGYKTIVTHASIRLGDIALVRNENEKAMNIYAGCIEVCDPSEELHKLANCFKGLGFVFSKSNKPEDSAQYFAISDSIFRKLGIKLPKKREEEVTRELELIRSELGDEKFGVVWNNASSLSLNDAISLTKELRC